MKDAHFRDIIEKSGKISEEILNDNTLNHYSSFWLLFGNTFKLACLSNFENSRCISMNSVF